MKNKFLTAGLVFVLAASAACSGDAGRGDAADTKSTPTQKAAQANAPAPPQQQAKGHDAQAGHGHGPVTSETPAFITDAAQLKSLAPTLSPELFNGKQKLGYIAAREIPQTLAQLPCYCYCDKGFGHKSLHSCFVDDHAAHCAVCIDEALVALRLEKQEGLKPEEVRRRIIAEFGSRQ